jgi:hypothetical protein
MLMMVTLDGLPSQPDFLPTRELNTMLGMISQELDQ